MTEKKGENELVFMAVSHNKRYCNWRGNYVIIKIPVAQILGGK